MQDIRALVDLVVPGPLADGLSWVAESTGLRWGPTSRANFWFQTPKEHIAQFVVVLAVCAVVYRQTRGFRQAATAALAVRGAGWSMKCPINRLCAVVMALCFASQVYTKASRPQPLIQLGWLLMPCHLATLAWVYVLWRERPAQYASCCCVGTLLVDYLWAPLMALQSPDWGDHRYAFEGHIFILHHVLLLALPFYFAARYHVAPLDRQHLAHLTVLPVAFYFGVCTPWAIVSGLNVNYMLYPPPVKGAPPALIGSPFYRVPSVAVLVALSVTGHYLVMGVAAALQQLAKLGRKAERKVKSA